MIYNVIQCGEPEGPCGGGPIEIRLGLERPVITPYSLKTQAKNRFNHLILMRAQIQHAERGGGVRGVGGFKISNVQFEFLCEIEALFENHSHAIANHGGPDGLV